jgi:hypothetical protein
MPKNNKVFLITHFNEDLYWTKSYKFDKLIFSKGFTPTNAVGKVFKVKNFGANQYDLINFICENYYNLPDQIVTLQGNPFEHCNQQKFNSLIFRKKYTRLESYFDQSLDSEKKRPLFQSFKDRISKVNIRGHYAEINTNWYVASVNLNVYRILGFTTCSINKLDDFLAMLFSDYRHLDIIQFTPGSQYIIEKKQCVKYSLKFWKALRAFIPKYKINGGLEAHFIERSLNLIFLGIYTEREKITLPKGVKYFDHISKYDRKRLARLRKILYVIFVRIKILFKGSAC